MRWSLGIRGRLALAILLTAVIPLAAAVFFANSMVQQASERFFVPDVRENLERSLMVYDELARTTKASMRHHAAELSADGELRQLARQGDREQLRRRLSEMIQGQAGVVRLTVTNQDGDVLAEVERGSGVDRHKEHQLIVERSLSASAAPADGESGDGPMLGVVLVTSKSPFESRARLADFIEAYSKLEERREADERTYVLAFASLLGLTILSAIAVGSYLARGVTRRVSELARATRRVAVGDLSIRVAEDSVDEIGDLGRAFNRMLSEVEGSRDRIEYLSRLASWQEMARRLAHEIKNPLTPIQLAVQEVHQRLDGLSEEQRRLLDTALEIVSAEVQTLRRLVGEFSEFARLPESRIEEADLAEFLRELQSEAQVSRSLGVLDADEAPPRFEFELPEAPCAVYLDRQLMRRVFINLISNAVGAARGADAGVRIRISLRRRQRFFELLVDDDGPGVPQALRSQIFEPYVTTKDDGTGLGLAIVKKIIIEHKGHIEMLQSPWGGARVRILLPADERASAPTFAEVVATKRQLSEPGNTGLKQR